MQLEVVTPKGSALSTEAEEVTAPGLEGEFGILPGHTPFLSALRAGVLTYRHKGKVGALAVGPGYAEVSGADRVIVLTQASARPAELDAAKLRAELEELDKQLKDFRQSEEGPSRAELDARRAWAQARLDAHGR